MRETINSLIATNTDGPGWERRPSNPEDDHVLEHTHVWLKTLPKGVRPVHLPTDFPRIVNGLATLWHATAALDRYFEEKEFSPRQNRRGFPALIKEELLAVHLYSLRTRQAAHDRVPQMASLLRR